MHHFRSSSFHSERLYLERKWKECLARGDLQFPIRKVKLYDSSGVVTYTLNGTGYFWIIPGHWTIIKMMNNTEKALNVLTTQKARDNECDEFHVDAGDCGYDGGDDVHRHGHSDRGGAVEDTEDAINSHEATLHQVEDYSKPDISTPRDGIHRAMDMMKTKLAISVSNLLGVTPLVNTLDKARKSLHKKENCQNRYYLNRYKDTFASVQHKCLQPTKSTQRK